MLVPMIWGAMTPWGGGPPPPTTVAMIDRYEVGTVQGHRYAHHHGHMGGTGGMSRGWVQRVLRNIPRARWVRGGGWLGAATRVTS